MNLSPSFSSQRGKSYGVEHLLAPQDGSVTEILEQSLQLAPAQTQFLLTMGAIYLNEDRIDSLRETPVIKKGDYLRVHQNPRRFPVEVLDLQSVVVFENQDLMVVNKPSGLPVHPTVDNTQENLIQLLNTHFMQKLLVTHRLDVGTQGLLILAKHKAAQIQVNQLLMQGQVQKIYRALVHGANVPLGPMTHYMEPSPRAPKTVSSVAQTGWAICQLNVMEQSMFNVDCCEVSIELITGRTHQIRAQLSASGYPIYGDLSYGSSVKTTNHESFCLQAFYLSFEWQGSQHTFRLPKTFSAIPAQ